MSELKWNRCSRSLDNLNEISEKYNNWVNRFYYKLGSLICRECDNYIYDKRDVCLYRGKIYHVKCCWFIVDQIPNGS